MDRELNTPARKSPRTGHGSFVLAAAISAMMVFPAAAQQPDAPAAAPAKGAAAPVPMQSWVKTCDTNKKTNQELCLIGEDVRSDSGQLIASILLRQITGEKKTSLLATVPMGMLLKPGLKLQVDNAAPISLVYGICSARTCLGMGEIDDSFISSMKAGKQLVLTTYNQQGQVVFSLPLGSFATAISGKGLSPTDFQKLLETRDKEFRAKADAARDALVKGERQENTNNPAAGQ